jgi:hypothetical protein
MWVTEVRQLPDGEEAVSTEFQPSETESHDGDPRLDGLERRRDAAKRSSPPHGTREE